MKIKKIKWIAVVLTLVLATSVGMLTSCGSSEGGSSSGKEYTLGDTSVRVWTNSTNNTFIEVIIPIKNNSEKDVLYCRNLDYELVDKDGNSVFKAEGSGSMAPMYLDPGEEGIIYNMRIYDSDTPYSEDMTLKYTETIEAITWEVTRITAGDLTFGAPNDSSCTINGTVTNDSGKDAEKVSIDILLYDKSGKIIGAAYDYIAEPVAAGATVAFDTYRYNVVGGNENIASYKATGYITN